MHLLKYANFDFLRWRWHAIVASLLIVLAGLALVVSRGIPLGIDFSGGTIVIVRFDAEVAADDVRSALASVPGEVQVQRYGDTALEWLIRQPLAEDAGESTSLDEEARRIIDLLGAADLPAFDVVRTRLLGPVIGADLQRRGAYAVVLALVAIAVYVAVRFRPSFAIGALAALFHDVAVTLACLVFFGYELSLNVVAALLTVVGYSVNDTIVIFDRVRENLRSARRDGLAAVVNRSVNQTLARTVITSGTTQLAVLALFLFGGEVLRGFAFTMFVGIVAGTYSTVFIASAIAIALSDRQRRRVAPAGAGAQAETPATGRKPRARVS